MPFKRVAVEDNQQVVTADILRLSELPEDLVRRVFQHFVLQGDSETYGWVLYGLEVADATAGATVQVSVSAGACILPPSAGDDAYRLLIVPATVNLPLTLPGAGTQTDVIQVRLAETPTTEEQRYKRTLGPGGVPQAALEAVDTQILVTGAPEVEESGGAVAAAGCVRLASVAMDTTEITGVTDRRAMMFKTYDIGNLDGDASWPGLRKALDRLAFWGDLTYDDLRVNTAIGGQMNSTVQMAAGDDLTIDATDFDIGTRDFNVNGAITSATVTATGLGTFQRVLVAETDEPEGYVAGPDGLHVNGGSIVRAIAHVRITRTWGGATWDFTSMTVAGHGCTVTRDGVGLYHVDFDVGGEDFGGAPDLGIREGHYTVEATISPFLNLVNGVLAARNALRAIPYVAHPYLIEADANNRVRIVVTSVVDTTTPLDVSFTVALRGPIISNTANPGNFL